MSPSELPAVKHWSRACFLLAVVALALTLPTKQLVLLLVGGLLWAAAMYRSDIEKERDEADRVAATIFCEECGCALQVVTVGPHDKQFDPRTGRGTGWLREMKRCPKWAPYPDGDYHHTNLRVRTWSVDVEPEVDCEPEQPPPPSPV